MIDAKAIAVGLGDIVRDLTRGAGFHVVADAPETFRALVASEPTHLPILGEFCEGTIFGDPHMNILSRVFHDTTHLKIGGDFLPEGEHRVTLEQCRIVEHRSTFLADVLFCDLFGQTEHMVKFGEFPVDQIGFVLHLLKTGEVARF